MKTETRSDQVQKMMAGTKGPNQDLICVLQREREVQYTFRAMLKPIGHRGWQETARAIDK